MKLQLLKEKEIPLLKRKRVTFMYNSQDQKTPVRTEVVKIVAKKLGAAQDSISIRHIYPQFGQSGSKIIAHIYKDKKTMEMYEQKSLIDKHSEKTKEEASAPAAPAAEEKTEEPKEEAKEEAPAKEEEKEAAKAQSSETASADKPEVKKDE